MNILIYYIDGVYQLYQLLPSFTFYVDSITNSNYDKRLFLFSIIIFKFFLKKNQNCLNLLSNNDYIIIFK